MQSFIAASLPINIYIEEKWLYPRGREGCFDTLESMFPRLLQGLGEQAFMACEKERKEMLFKMTVCVEFYL